MQKMEPENKAEVRGGNWLRIFPMLLAQEVARSLPLSPCEWGALCIFCHCPSVLGSDTKSRGGGQIIDY